MKALSKYNAPMTLPSLLVVLLIPLVIAFTWIGVVVPHLSAYISSLADSYPVTHAFLQSFIRFMFLPVFVVPVFVMVHFYQRYYDRKKRGHDAA